jgi:hypothetical protein
VSTTFLKVRDPVEGVSRKRVGRREDLHTSSDALNVKDTIVLVSDMDSEPDGRTSDDDNASDNMIWPMKIPTRRRRFC